MRYLLISVLRYHNQQSRTYHRQNRGGAVTIAARLILTASSRCHSEGNFLSTGHFLQRLKRFLLNDN